MSRRVLLMARREDSAGHHDVVEAPPPASVQHPATLVSPGGSATP
jgi:hypothetical protein